MRSIAAFKGSCERYDGATQSAEISTSKGGEHINAQHMQSQAAQIMQAQQGGLMGPENMRGMWSGYAGAMFPVNQTMFSGNMWGQGGVNMQAMMPPIPEVWFRAMMGAQLGGNGQRVANERSTPEGFSGHSSEQTARSESSTAGETPKSVSPTTELMEVPAINNETRTTEPAAPAPEKVSEI